MADRKPNSKKQARAERAQRHVEQMAARFGKEIERSLAGVQRLEAPVTSEVEGRVPEVHAFADVLVVAVPKARRAREEYWVDEAALVRVMRDRIHFALDIVDALGHKQVVLGAWGCGVFGWEAELVSELFREELASGSHGIELAIFAVPRDRFNENLACFEYALSTFPERNQVSFADALAERRAAEQAAAAAEEAVGEEDDWRKYL